MADKNSEGQSPAPDCLNKALQAIEETLSTGSIPEDLAISADVETNKKLQAILMDISATQRFTLALAQGNLSQDLAARGRMAGCLKTLQSGLRHLTWQAGQIAGGDLSQRVHFMGDFSDSFNTMVERLSEEKINRARREDDLRRINATLADEIAERRKIEDALRLANKKITMLSSITRHDIRNQLLALRGFLGLSLMSAKEPELIGFIRKGDRAAETIGNQIEFTKYYEEIGVNAPEWQDIAELIQMTRSELPIPDSVKVTADLPHVNVYADGLIEKVFYNLMENTLRHGENVSRIRFSFIETDSGAEIVYEDNGIGISAEDKPHIFQKGFGKNTGLGLFLSQEILAITGLSMQEEGEPGKGVRFVIAVPKDGYRISGES
ncbi:MAG: ATP-binding protein [Methanoregula sp.]